MEHEKLKIIIDAMQDNQATEEEQRLGREHLSGCAECQEDVLITQRYSTLLKTDVPALGVEFSQRVMNLIQEEQKMDWGALLKWFIPIPVLAMAFFMFTSMRSNESPTTSRLLLESVSHDAGMESIFLDNNVSDEMLLPTAEGEQEL